ncbi:MAG: hypothetical protein UU96_C0002G0003 [Parcubacteria group bacterium GW2011_GWC2_42_13]|nr:MAG: hypothetical protein UU96_C0002G0003 [Parcubacteria group bacterium GW2011_GWC2_42_13]
MNLHELKIQSIRDALGISAEQFPRILTFIDFANVDHWFDYDQYDLDGKALLSDQRIALDLQKLKEFLGCFSVDVRFYYGHDPSNSGSMAFNRAAKYIFGKHRVFTKRIQQVRHDLALADSVSNTRLIHSDNQGNFVLIPKCNFDVEISVDALRLDNMYDTICLLSSDADFAALIRYLKKQKKKIILIKGGRIDGSLGKLLDLKIDASQIKSYVVQIKQKPGIKPGSADS